MVEKRSDKVHITLFPIVSFLTLLDKNSSFVAAEFEKREEEVEAPYRWNHDEAIPPIYLPKAHEGNSNCNHSEEQRAGQETDTRYLQMSEHGKGC